MGRAWFELEARRVAKEVEITFGRSYRFPSKMVLPMTWTATGPAWLFPQLEADIEIAPLGADRTQLSVSASYRPPMGTMGRMFDRALLHRVAKSPASTVLLTGESGTGKNLLCKKMHELSPRKSMPFVEIGCANIPEHLIESELFGYEKGAFTGAQQSRPGLFQAAGGGVLFLDEIGLLPESLQAKLLKALEERTVRRVGSTRSETVDVWILAA